jgi:hypothetical protein
LKKNQIVFPLVILSILIMAKTGSAKIVFSLKSSAGYGKIFGGDINTIFASHDNYYSELADRLGMAKSGQFAKISGAIDGQVALICDLSDRFGIGIGVEYIRGQKDSRVALSMAPLYQSETSVEGTFQAVPITLSACFRQPLAKDWALVIEAGLVYCIGTLSYSMSLEEEISTASMTSQTQGTVDDHGFGFRGALGLSYRVANGIDLLIECAGQYAWLNHWQGEENYSDTEKNYERRRGSLWYYEFYDEDAGKTYPNLILSSAKPEGSDIKIARLFDNSLSHISVRAGVRIRL